MLFSNRPFAWRVILALVVAIAISAINVVLLRAETWEVRVQSGRTFIGAVDPNSNADRLWLRSESAGGAVLRPIEWNCVVSATQGDRTMDGNELRRNLNRYVEPVAAELPPPENAPPAEILPSREPAMPANPVVRIKTPVRSLQIDAYLANFNSTAEADGLILHVYPVDARGRIVPVDGTLDVELWGTARNDLQKTDEFPKLGRWVEMVRATDVDQQGAVFQLPFQAAHPEFNLEFGSKAIVHAKLAIPGEGVFEAHTGAIRVREYNPIRDWRQQREGTRFFPSERTSRGDR